MNMGAVFGDPARKEQKNRHMPVVAAAVHVAGVLRAVGHVICLVIVDAVHIGAKGDGRLGVPSEKHGLHTADGRRLDAVRTALAQLAQDISLRIAQLKADLGNAVQVLADAHRVVIHGFDLFTQMHTFSHGAGWARAA